MQRLHSGRRGVPLRETRGSVRRGEGRCRRGTSPQSHAPPLIACCRDTKISHARKYASRQRMATPPSRTRAPAPGLRNRHSQYPYAYGRKAYIPRAREAEPWLLTTFSCFITRRSQGFYPSTARVFFRQKVTKRLLRRIVPRRSRQKKRRCHHTKPGARAQGPKFGFFHARKPPRKMV